jgi:hypothetical protein
MVAIEQLFVKFYNFSNIKQIKQNNYDLNCYLFSISFLFSARKNYYRNSMFNLANNLNWMDSGSSLGGYLPAKFTCRQEK